MFSKKSFKTFVSLIIFLGLSSMNVAAKDTPLVMGNIYMITLHTDNFSSMKIFYSETLEMKVIEENGEFVEFSSKGVRLSLISRKSLNNSIPAESLQNLRTGSGVGIGFKFATNQEVDTAYNSLKSKGVNFVAKPKLQSWGEYTAFFSDPDGNVHELVSY